MQNYVMLKAKAKSKSKAKKRLMSLGTLFLSQTAFASVTGPSMPWDDSLTVIEQALSGSTAHICIVIAISLAGLGFAFGEHGGAFRKAMAIILGGSIAVGAGSLYITLHIGGAIV